MKSARAALLVVAAVMIFIGAAGNAFNLIPDLHGDLVELGVRRTVLGGSVILMDFAALAMFGFLVIVGAAAIQALRGVTPARLPLAVTAAVYVAGGSIAYSWSHSPHHLGNVAAGLALAVAAVIPGPIPNS
jgi:hypothetical protein